MIGGGGHFRIVLRPVVAVQTVGVRQHHHPVTLVAQALHDVDHFRAQRDEYRLPAGGELLEAERDAHFIAQLAGEVFVADFTAFMLLEYLTHGETIGQHRQRRAAQIAPHAQHTLEIDIDDHIT